MKQLFKFPILLLVIISCHRDNADYIGPGYIAAPSDFAVTSFTAATSPVDFTTSNIVFNASFTDKVSWVLTITGQTSGAVHKVNGISSGLSNVTWAGAQDDIMFFKTGETATAVLSFLGTTLAPSIDITITKAQNFTTCGTFPTNGDFEDTSQIHFPNWARFNSAKAEQGTANHAVDYNGNVVPAVEGNWYYYVKGIGAQTVFVDGIQYIGPMSPKPPNTPDNVWVNMYIYGTGDVNAQVTLDYQESDYNGAHLGYQPAEDDAYVATITLNHKGWKLFSFKYSDLPVSSDPLFGGNGNKIREPRNIKSFDLVLLKATNPNSPVEVYFDYPIITVGGPFKPCK